VAVIAGSLKTDSFYPPAYSGCPRIERARPGTNCAMGLGGPDAPDCPDGAQAERLERRWLDRHGYADWDIVVIPPKSLSSNFCYVYSRVYPERQEVRLRSMVDDPNR